MKGLNSEGGIQLFTTIRLVAAKKLPLCQKKQSDTYKHKQEQAGMSSAQPQAEAVSLKFWLVFVYIYKCQLLPWF